MPTLFKRSNGIDYAILSDEPGRRKWVSTGERRSEFAEAELRDMIAFYKTPTGQKAIAKLPALMAKGAQIGQQRIQEHLPELQEAIKKRIQEETKEPTPKG